MTPRTFDIAVMLVVIFILATYLAGCATPQGMAAIAFYGVATGGLPSYAAHEIADHTKRVCAAAHITYARVNDYQCVTRDMARRRGELLHDISQGGWKP